MLAFTTNNRCRRLSLILVSLLIATFVFLIPPVSAAGVSPAVRSTTSGTTTLVTGTIGNYVYNMPGNHVDGDLIIVIVVGIAGATQPTFTFMGNNFHTLYNLWTTGSRVTVAGWFIDDGATGTKMEFVASIANTYRYIVYAIDRNTWYWGSPPEVGTAATGTTVNPDPPAVTPTWGSDENLFIATGGWASTATRSACPTNYATPTDVTGTSPGMSACLRTLTGTTDNPGTFTISASSAWTTQTIVVRGGPDISARFTTSMAGLTATFTSTVTGAIGAVTYAWTFGDGATSTLASPSRTYASGGQYQVALTVTDTLAQYTAWATVIIGYPSLIASASESPGGNCANGGQKITYGLDNGDGGGTAMDGTLQSGEVDTTIYVCNGAAGSNGSPGANGYNSLISTATASESPGVNCASGGTKVTVKSGLDNGDGGGTANNGVLEAGEVDQTTVYYSCTGATGATGAAGSNGANGYNSLVSTSIAAESPGVNCANGGTKVTVKSGLDNGDGGGTANNGILEAGEVDQTTNYYSCTGNTGATGSTGAAGHNSLIVTDATVGTNCNAFAGTGTRVRVGVDSNDDGTLQAGEVQYTSHVCNGLTGATGATGPTGLTGPAGLAGSDGYNSLVKITAESAGVNCANAGQRIESGLDNGDGGGTARDGILQAGEVDAGPVYACNGGGHQALVSSATEPPGANCATGGVKVTSGTDTNDDSILQAGEITSTSYACNGAQGPTGASGAPGASGGMWLFLMLLIIAPGILLGATPFLRKPRSP